MLPIALPGSYIVSDCPTPSDWSARSGGVSLTQPFKSSSLTFHPELLGTISFVVWMHYFIRSFKIMTC